MLHSIRMRQKNFARGVIIRKINRHRRRFRFLLAADAGEEELIACYRRIRAARRDLGKMNIRAMEISSTSFNLNKFNDEESLRLFRFRPRDMNRIVQLCGWTSGKTKRSRYVVEPVTAVCIALRKLSYPTRWKDLEKMFGMRASAMCEVFYEVIESLVNNHGKLLETFRIPFMQQRAEMYAKAISEKGAPLDNCVGFIDCTKIQMCRPSGRNAMQKSTYSGHKRFHCLIYQTVTTPDGLLFYLFGPEVGRRHDMTLYRESGLGTVLEEGMVIDGKQYCIFGDAAYILRAWLQTAYQSISASPQEMMYNAAMSAVREAVEWTYKDVKQLWSSQDFKREMKVRRSPLALLYKASALLWNFHVCICPGGQTSMYFDVAAPTLNEYLNL